MSDLSDEEPFSADSSDNYEPSDNSHETESEAISETRSRSKIEKRKTKSELVNWKRNVKKKQTKLIQVIQVNQSDLQEQSVQIAGAERNVMKKLMKTVETRFYDNLTRWLTELRKTTI
ncbi:hypothetical protein QE152_g30956 [Popillia japonica]|uniref:No apical meristem-associated C-terminal domain-containing protein n=1 Tax=Popillia japonica TaxID=7064 RepID=A0AAW1JD08_POPJA